MQRFSKSTTASNSPSADNVSAIGLSPSEKREQPPNDAPGQGNSVLSPLDRSNRDASPAPKKRKVSSKSAGPKLSFGVDEEEGGDGEDGVVPAKGKRVKVGRAETSERGEPADDTSENEGRDATSKRIGANKLAGFAPKAITKHALRQEGLRREALREEFKKTQEVVKQAEIIVPFVFFEGTNSLSGRVRMKKGDKIDVLLSGAQKILVKHDYRRHMHLKLDDLMLVRGDVMIPHYLTVHYFILKGTRGSKGLIFDLSADPPDGNTKDMPESQLEGADRDPDMTKVVDVKWYHAHKHIYPCNVWEWFDPHDPDKDYSHARKAKRDAHGNSFFG